MTNSGLVQSRNKTKLKLDILMILKQDRQRLENLLNDQTSLLTASHKLAYDSAINRVKSCLGGRSSHLNFINISKEIADQICLDDVVISLALKRLIWAESSVEALVELTQDQIEKLRLIAEECMSIQALNTKAA